MGLESNWFVVGRIEYDQIYIDDVNWRVVNIDYSIELWTVVWCVIKKLLYLCKQKIFAYEA